MNKFYIVNPGTPLYRGEHTMMEWIKIIQSRYRFEQPYTAKEVVETMMHLGIMRMCEDIPMSDAA